EDDRVVEIVTSAAVLHGRPRVQPALGAELPPQLAQLEVALVVVLGRHRRPGDARRDVGGEPAPHLLPESLLLLGVGDLEVHAVALLVASGSRVASDYANTSVLCSPTVGARRRNGGLAPSNEIGSPISSSPCSGDFWIMPMASVCGSAR